MQEVRAMLDEFARYCAMQRDQSMLASLLVYLKRKGGFVQLNSIWRELGPTSGGPFWNQTTLVNKLDKLERLGVVIKERRILPSPRAEAKKKTNTFFRLNPATPLYPHIFGMLLIYKQEPDKYSSELVEKPLGSSMQACRKVQRQRSSCGKRAGGGHGFDRRGIFGGRRRGQEDDTGANGSAGA